MMFSPAFILPTKAILNLEALSIEVGKNGRALVLLNTTGHLDIFKMARANGCPGVQKHARIINKKCCFPYPGNDKSQEG